MAYEDVAPYISTVVNEATFKADYPESEEIEPIVFAPKLADITNVYNAIKACVGGAVDYYAIAKATSTTSAFVKTIHREINAARATVYAAQVAEL